jgi:dihydrolipoamide dehydrogenase
MRATESFDLIVIGSGAGLNVAAAAHAAGRRVALIDDGPLGGTCLNRGCIPTKIILYPAELATAVREAAPIGVHADAVRIDFATVMRRARELVAGDVAEMQQSLQQAEGFTFINARCRFVAERELEVAGRRLSAPQLLIAAGAREWIPDWPGLEEVGYLTSTSALQLEAPPAELVIVGGGYIACEFGHFFAAVGSRVTLVGRNRQLVPAEEPEIAAELERRLGRRMAIHTGVEALGAEQRAGRKVLLGRDVDSGQPLRFEADALLLAAGRRSNADWFQPEAAGVRSDAAGWVEVDEYLRTSAAGVWAIGDAIGRNQFRHSANAEADVVWHNMSAGEDGELEALDERAVPHAVFTHPEIAAVGLREQEAIEAGHLVMVGEADYSAAIKGYAMDAAGSRVKVVLDARDRRILGAHAIGPCATAMVQPLVYLMHAGAGDFLPLVRAQTIHPAMEEIMVRAFGNLRPGRGQEQHFQHRHHH